MTYDEELPAGFQDADFEMAEMEAVGNQLARQRRRGICTHGHMVGFKINPDTGKVFYPEQEGLVEGQSRCMDCKQVFQSDDEWWDERQEAMYR